MVARIFLLAYGTFAPEERDAKQSPSFYRMVPDEAHQNMGIIRLLLHFQWTWVGLFAVIDDSAEHFLKVLEPLLSQNGICLAFRHRFPKMYLWNFEDPITDFLLNMYLPFRDSKANTFILYGETLALIAFTTYMFLASDAFQEIVSVRKIWIMTAQVDFALTGLHRAWDFQLFHGTIFFAIHSNEVLGFQSFLQDIKPHHEQGNGFLKDFWEQAFDCLYSNPQEPIKISGTCTGEEKLEKLPRYLFELFITGHSYSIYNAVYAVAHALHAMYSSRSYQRSMDDGQGVAYQDLQPWQVIFTFTCLY
ncbi:UNVERIFIED_CONTAM: hypothetical protein K2H54_044607 [Gekko kuhli]